MGNDTIGQPLAARKPYIPARRRRGISPLQIILGLLMSLGIFIAIIQGYNRGNNMIKNMQLGAQLVRINNTIDEVWKFRGDFPLGSITETVITRGEFSGQNVSGTAPNRVLVSPYDTTVIVNGRGGRDYEIRIDDLSDNACATLLERFIGATREIDGASVEFTALTIPLTGTEIDARCAGQADNKYTVHILY